MLISIQIRLVWVLLSLLLIHHTRHSKYWKLIHIGMSISLLLKVWDRQLYLSLKAKRMVNLSCVLYTEEGSLEIPEDFHNQLIKYYKTKRISIKTNSFINHCGLIRFPKCSRQQNSCKSYTFFKVSFVIREVRFALFYFNSIGR